MHSAFQHVEKTYRNSTNAKVNIKKNDKGK